MYVSENEEMMAIWNWKKNKEFSPESLSVGSHKKVSWICENGHEWEASIRTVHNNCACPYCSGKMLVKGINDFETLCPEAAAEWDYDKNIGIYPNEFTPGSKKKVWWKCAVGHQWDATIYKRAQGTNCPYCSNHRVLTGFNDLATKRPEIASEWDYEKNGDITPNEIVYVSTKSFYWKCNKCGHEWKASVRNRVNHNTGCPECGKIKLVKTRRETELKKNGSVADTPLIEDWDFEKNTGIDPKKISKHSNDKVWWKCHKCGYEWKTMISSRSRGTGCACCANKVTVKGINDLITTNPELAAEWDYDKNGDLTPEMFTRGSGEKVWWKCPKGHSYQATILHRSSGTNCPKCNEGRQTSFAEQAIFFYISQIFPDATNRDKDALDGEMELDIYIPSIKVAIEYDGSFWHKENHKDRERRKYKLCHEKGIKLVRIKEKRGNDADIADVIYSAEGLDKNKNLDVLIRQLIDKLDPASNMWTRTDPLHVHSDVSIDLERDNFKIRKYMIENEKRSLAELFPELSKEWHPTKNGSLKPDMFKPGSDTRVWWKCPQCGHEWETTIGQRSTGTGCPECYKKRVKENSPLAKKIAQYDQEGNFIKEWKSVSEASRSLNISSGNISACARGERRIASGYVWKYVDFREDIN